MQLAGALVSTVKSGAHISLPLPGCYPPRSASSYHPGVPFGAEAERIPRDFLLNIPTPSSPKPFVADFILYPWSRLRQLQQSLIQSPVQSLVQSVAVQYDHTHTYSTVKHHEIATLILPPAAAAAKRTDATRPTPSNSSIVSGARHQATHNHPAGLILPSSSRPSLGGPDLNVL